MPEVIWHWWGVELKFTKEQKEKLIPPIDIAGGVVGPAAAADFFGVIELGATLGPLTAVLAALVAALAGELAAFDYIGTGGFKICIPWIAAATGGAGITLLPNF
jgi:hypothetical protein